jgi:uncharacterized membrane protein YeaQ/YmgE (transglycosylase-associated protein family)
LNGFIFVEEEDPMFGVLGWILFGLVAGVIAKLLMPGRDPGGFIVTILLGIAGAFLGGFLGRAMGFYGEGEPAGMIMSILGAVLLLAIYRVTMRRRVHI